MGALADVTAINAPIQRTKNPRRVKPQHCCAYSGVALIFPEDVEVLLGSAPWQAWHYDQSTIEMCPVFREELIGLLNACRRGRQAKASEKIAEAHAASCK